MEGEKGAATESYKVWRSKFINNVRERQWEEKELFGGEGEEREDEFLYHYGYYKFKKKPCSTGTRWQSQLSGRIFLVGIFMMAMCIVFQ